MFMLFHHYFGSSQAYNPRPTAQLQNAQADIVPVGAIKGARRSLSSRQVVRQIFSQGNPTGPQNTAPC